MEESDSTALHGILQFYRFTSSEMAELQLSRCSAALHGIVQWEPRINPIHLGSHQAKFQLNPLRNG